MISDFLWNIEFIVSSFRVLVPIVSKSVIDHFITPCPYVRLGIAHVLIALILLLLLRSDFKTFLTLVRYSFSRFSSLLYGKCYRFRLTLSIHMLPNFQALVLNHQLKAEDFQLKFFLLW